MSTCQQEDLNVVEGNAYSYSCHTWKLTSCAMAAKVSQTTSWVPKCMLPWAQHKKWIPIGLMECVHTHQRRPTNETCGSSSYVRGNVEKNGEDKWKVGKIG